MLDFALNSNIMTIHCQEQVSQLMAQPSRTMAQFQFNLGVHFVSF